MQLRDEAAILRFEIIRGGLAGYDQDTVLESGCLFPFEREVQLLLSIAEDFLPEWIGREQAIPAGVPIGGVARVAWMIEYRKRYVFSADSAREHCPTAAGSPYFVAGLSFAAGVAAGDAGVIQHGNGGGVAAGVGEDLRFVRWLFQLTRDAHADHAFLVVVKNDALVEGAKRCDSIDGAQPWAGVKDERSVLM